MNGDFMLCAREVKRGAFTAEPGPSQYLIVPDGAIPSPRHAVHKDSWVRKLRAKSTWGKDSRDPRLARGDLLVFVHGYNNNLSIVTKRHRQLKRDLVEAGFKGEVMTFCWPSDDMTFNYLEDRHDAKATAMQLVTDGIGLLARVQTPDCAINVHLLGHSTGAYVIREAFDDADDSKLENSGWTISQIAFIAADISSASLSEGNSSSDSLFRHCLRLTNYSNRHDSVLKLSNAKRLGMAPRAGRVGLPDDAPRKSVEIDCTDYFGELSTDQALADEDQRDRIGTFEHSWHIGNRVFALDLFETLKGDRDRTVVATRDVMPSGGLRLTRPEQR